MWTPNVRNKIDPLAWHVLGIELELACNRGSCWATFLHANIFNDISPHAPPLQASSISIPRIRIWCIQHFD